MLAVCGALSGAERNHRFALLLEDRPLAAEVSAVKDIARAASRDRLAEKQNVLKTALAERGFTVTASDTVLINAVFVQGPAGLERDLQQLPGVVRVERLRPHKRHLTKAIDLMKVPGAWSAVNGEQNAGAGVKIAIIDTGIDQTHPAFAEGSLQYPAGFPKCQESRGDCAYVNRKVIVARSYVQMLVGTDPQFSYPDDLSPRDRVGHGTAVAAAAAGVRNTGPVGAFSGVAPAAWLGNYKVFGSPGVNGRYTYEDVIVQALNDAVSDGMNVAVLALGAPAVWGPSDTAPPVDCRSSSTGPCDWRAEVVENASRLGLAVVVSAGNDGDYATRWPAYNSIQTPGTAPSAITVGASTNSHILYQSLTVDGPNVPADLRRLNTYFGNGPKPDAPVTATARDVRSAGNDGLACQPLSNNSLTGMFAIIERGECQLALKVQYAQRAGAVGVIMAQPNGVDGIFPMQGLEETGIPAVLIGNRNASALRTYISSNASARVTIDPALTEISTTEVDEVAVFSSRGPSIREHGIKPELVAVGTDLYTATQRYDPNGELYDKAGYTTVNGTSFAAPLVAGTVAMVKQRNPQFTPAQLKSAVVNTANPAVADYDGNQRITAGVLDVGAGKLDAEAALRTNVTVEPAVVSFGVLGTSLPPARGLTLCNHSSGDLNINIRVTPYSNQSSSASVLVNRTSFTLPRGCTTDVNVRLDGSRPSAGVYEGVLEISGGAVPLRLPWVYIVGDGVPFSLLPLGGDGFEAVPGTEVRMLFKVVDRYGAPVPNQAVAFQATVGGGTVDREGKTTDDLGIGYAYIIVGPELGEQEFYVAVGPDRNFGMYFAGRSRQQPAIASGGVVDAASVQAGQGFSAGSYISIFGRGLSEATRAFNTPYLPISLAGVAVSLDVPSQNISVPGRLTYVSDGQINVSLPYELQGVSSVQMKVMIGDTISSLVTVPIVSQSPALFEYTDSGGRLLAAAVNETGVVGSGNPARKDGIVSLYVNGLGPTDPQPPSGEAAPANPLAVTRVRPDVTIGGQRAEVLFSGLAPGFVGLYQLNVRVPSGSPTGVQPVVVTANGVASKTSNMPVE